MSSILDLFDFILSDNRQDLRLQVFCNLNHSFKNKAKVVFLN
jgi:hypothetical protein